LRTLLELPFVEMLPDFADQVVGEECRQDRPLTPAAVRMLCTMCTSPASMRACCAEIALWNTSVRSPFVG